MSGVLAVCLAIVAASYVWAPRPAGATVVGGPIVLMGIDAEDGGPGGHGPISVYQSVTSSVLANTSKGSGILVLGGGKSATDNVTAFWDTIAAGLGKGVTYANGAAVGTVVFTPYELVVVVSDDGNTPSGGLTAAENDALATRDQDFADHVNAGGGLFGFSQTGLAAPWYPYLDAIGSFVVQSGGGSDVTATSEGTAVGIDDSLDVCCWHDDYVSFPSFLQPLALYAGTTNIAAIGGQRVVVLRSCTPGEATASVTRPAAGTFYVNDVASGSSGSTLAGVTGSTLTVNVGTTGTVGSVNVEVDGTLAGTDSAAPFSVVVPVPPAPGLHTIRVSAFHATLPCVARMTVSFLVPDPAVAARALGVSAVVDVPTEPVVTAGGVSVGGKGGSPSPVTVVDRTVPPVVDRATVISDSADGSATSTPLSAHATSKVTGLSLLGGLIRADLIQSKVTATYNPATKALTLDSSGTQLGELWVNGRRIAVDVADLVSPDLQTIPIPGVGVLVLNEVVQTRAGRRGEITVNALHLFLDPGYAATEVVVASAYAAVNYLTDAFDGPADDLIRHPDDLHTGTDAGGTRASAMPIAPGIHPGALTRGDASDFYRFDTRQGERIVAVVKPAERTRLTVAPGPAPTVTRENPEVNLELTDPGGTVRSRSVLATAGSMAQKVEINADTPYAPATAKGTWVLEVKRRAGSADGGYTIEFLLLPVALLDQADAGVPGDAGDTCATARPLPFPLDVQGTRPFATTGVIRDADTADFFSLDVEAGHSLTVTLKPDELADGADFDLFLYQPSAPGGIADCTLRVGAVLSGGGDGTKGHPEVVALLPVTTSGRYVLEIRRVNAVANYYLGVTSANSQLTVQAPDAGTGLDAGNTCAAAMPLAPGAYQGRLADLPAPDYEDWYGVTLTAGADLLAVMAPHAPSNFTVELYGPGCTRMPADQLTTGAQPASAPETVHAGAAPAGTYRIRVLRDPASAGNYVLGVVVKP